MAVLNTSEERIKLLRAGFDGKKIEQLWIEKNNFRVIPKLLKTEEMKI